MCIVSGGKAFGGGNWSETLSPQWMLSCHRDQGGCRGGQIDIAWSDLRNQGIATKACLLYATTRATSATGTGLWAGTVAVIQAEIMGRGPVEATIVVFRELVYYKSGVYHLTGGSKFVGNHAVKLDRDELMGNRLG
eukprot:m51a1_g928 hypothetical protein (136) ;mRNA; r:206774-207462